MREIEGYRSNNYAEFFKGLVLVYRPKELIEIGIGEGYSLSALLAGVKEIGYGHIRAYDIFEEWSFFHRANREELKNRFGKERVLEILEGNFFEIHKTLNDNSVDFFDIDVANDGKKFEFFFENYLQKLKKTGIAVLEGGSVERDQVHWMRKYSKRLIRPVLTRYEDRVDFFTVEPFPSATLIKRIR